MARRNLLDDDWKKANRHVSITREEICSDNQNIVSGPAAKTRSSKKRELYKLAPTQGDEEPQLEDHQAHNIKTASNVPSKPQIPEKRVLELILDTLQRIDTHEIFAEPVDPNEVEDYYEIIKEPMDFGTMRAKLHEGMYESLEQFESDVFLITKNAMHFNPSGSIYFKEARVVDELATEVFCALENCPESFESGFSEVRLRSARRTRPKLANDAKSNSSTIGYSSLKSVPSSTNTSLNTKRRTRYRGGCNEIGSRSIESDKRCTYRPWRSSLDQTESIISLMSSNRKQLDHVVPKDICYNKSLMSFVKDLGPVVQAIARQKLVGSNFPIINRSAKQNRSVNAPQTSARTADERMEVLEDSGKVKRTSFNTKARNLVGEEATLSTALSASSLLARARDPRSSDDHARLFRKKPCSTVVDRPLEVDFRKNRFDSASGDCLREDDRGSMPHFALGFPNTRSLVGQTNAFRQLAFLHQSSGSKVNFFNA